MGTRAARTLHLALFLTGVVLYVVFILPRWWVLTGDIPSSLATAGRIAAGLPIAVAAWPVWQILQAALRNKQSSPEIALRLRAWSAVLHVVAGVLILLAAIAEIWLSLEAGGPYLFGVYGAAGAIAILAFLALYLSFVAEKPPAAPKPPKAAKVPKAKRVTAKKVTADKAGAEKKPRGKKRGAKSTAPAAADAESDAEATHAVAAAEVVTNDEADDSDAVTPETPETQTAIDETQPEPDDVADEAHGAQPSTGALRNQRPAGKRRHRLGR